jgi:hypothetical protein
VAVGGLRGKLMRAGRFVRSKAVAIALATLISVIVAQLTGGPWGAAVASASAQTVSSSDGGWQVVSLGGDRTGLEQVQCPDSSHCIALEDFARAEGPGVRVETNGIWSTLPVALGPGLLSCPTAGFCMYLQTESRSRHPKRLALPQFFSWNPTNYTGTQSMPAPPPPPWPHALHSTAFVTLSGLSCVSANSCMAVGSYSGWDHRRAAAIVESWNGSAWSVMSLPRYLRNDGLTKLVTVSCGTPSFCQVLGYSSRYSFEQAAWWTGNGQWHYTNLASAYSDLTRISCYGVMCMASGSRDYVQWFGGRFATAGLFPTPTGTTNFAINGVSCPAEGPCTAVGVYQGSVSDNPLAYVWKPENHPHWRPMNIRARPNALGSYLNSVSCTGLFTCTAVGYQVEPGGNGAYPTVPLVEEESRP